MRVLFLLFMLASCVHAQPDGPSFTGVDVRDVATRHYFNPFDGLMLDRNPYPQELVDDAEALLAFLKEVGEGPFQLAPLSSVRVLGWTPGRLEVLAIGVADGRAAFRRATFLSAARTVEDVRPVSAAGAEVFISLKDLTLSLRTPDGAFALVDPIGAGGYKDEQTHVLMTPPMRPEVTRTPGRAWMDAKRYKGGARGSGYMIRARTHPEYYEGLPFVRLRRFDQGVDEYGIHGPISRSGTFPLPPLMAGEQLARLRRLAPRYTKDAEGLADKLIEDGVLDPETRLVRGRISNGCIRLRARDIRELYAVLDSLSGGAPVTVSYASDPRFAAHPFPWESRRFAVATQERDEDGLTVMYTADIKNKAGMGAELLPFPDDAEVARLDARAARDARAVSKRAPAEWARVAQR
jgi:hypothetical protein